MDRTWAGPLPGLSEGALMHDSSMRKMKELVDQWWHEQAPAERKPRVLEVGSLIVGNDPSYRDLFKGRNVEYVGMDIQPGPGVDVVVAKPYDWTELGTSFDLVISGQCLEHVEMPWFWIWEIRALTAKAPHGRAFIIAPSKGPWHCPPDYWRFHFHALEALVRYADLKVVESGFVENSPDWGDAYVVLKHE